MVASTAAAVAAVATVAATAAAVIARCMYHAALPRPERECKAELAGVQDAVPNSSTVKNDECSRLRQYSDLACVTHTHGAYVVGVGQRFERKRSSISLAPLWIGIEKTATTGSNGVSSW